VSERRGARASVSRVLLVGSQYDAFLLDQAGFRRAGRAAAAAPSAPAGPEFVLAQSGAAAQELLQDVAFDLVLADLDLPDLTGFALGRLVKQRFPSMPFVVLTSNKEYGRSPVFVPEREEVDYLFVWYGNTDLLRAIVWLIEDEAHLPQHIAEHQGAALLLVEDEATFASHYLPLLYDTLRAHAQKLVQGDAAPAGEWQDTDNRPLLLYRQDFEAACACFEQCAEGLIGVISDLEFPRDGHLDPMAGLLLTRYVKERAPTLPVVIQSHDRDLADRVHAGIASFLWKGSDRLLGELRGLLEEYFGFGAFIFRTPEGEEVARAHDLAALAACVARVPGDVFLNHGRRRHFSTWLSIHGELELAREVRQISPQAPRARQRFLALLKSRLASGAPRVLDRSGQDEPETPDGGRSPR